MSDPGPSVPPPRGSLPQTISPTTPTILASLQELITKYQNQPLSTPYLHPYAPSLSNSSSRKGKQRDDSTVDRLESLRDTIGRLKASLAGGTGVNGDKEGQRLIRALKEVNAHQTALLPSLSTLLPIPHAQLSPLFPSSQLLLHPTALLQTLATSLGLQAFLEDSQFGLLKTSLAIAGTRFVLDVDLEADPTPDDADGDAEDDPDEPMLSSSAGTSGAARRQTARADEHDLDRGTVRLSKLSSNHVMVNGGTGKSEWINKVIRETIEGYLSLWNKGNDLESEYEKVVEKERAVRLLEDELRALKELDDLVQDQVDWFEELEQIAKYLQGLMQSGGSTRLYPTQPSSVFPTFRLLDQSTQLRGQKGGNEVTNPTFRIRPSRIGEKIPCVLPNDSTNMGMDLDAENGNTSPWLKGSWILEYVCDDEMEVGAGVVVRRSWLSKPSHVGGKERPGEDETMTPGSIRVENLIYRPLPQPQILMQIAQPFPYTATFIHGKTAQEGIGSERALDQHWSMAQPGPTGWLVGRIGISSQEGLVVAVEALRRQLVLNQLFESVFKAETLQVDDDTNHDAQDDVDDWLNAPQMAFPLTLAMEESTITIIFPRTSSNTAEGDQSDLAEANVQVVVCPSDNIDKGYVDVTVRVDGVEKDVYMGEKWEFGRDLVRLVREVDARLKVE